MNDPRIAALAEALRRTGVGRDDQLPELDTLERCAAAILAALQAEGWDIKAQGWGIVAASSSDTMTYDARDEVIARLRKIEEAARAHIAWEYRMRGAPRFTMTMLRAALEADHA